MSNTNERAELIAHYRSIEQHGVLASIRATAKATADILEADAKALVERVEFEAWAKREGLNTQRAESKNEDRIPSSRFGLCPATYYFDEVECAWRAWANKPVAQQVAVPATGGAEDKWRKLALQFDGQRMQALGHLRAMTLNPHAHMSEAMKFLAAPPTHAQQVAVPVPMTDTEIYVVARNHPKIGALVPHLEVRQFARDIEAHHKIGAKQ